jgi:hypothetical protein
MRHLSKREAIEEGINDIPRVCPVCGGSGMKTIAETFINHDGEYDFWIEEDFCDNCDCSGEVV